MLIGRHVNNVLLTFGNMWFCCCAVYGSLFLVMLYLHVWLRRFHVYFIRQTFLH